MQSRTRKLSSGLSVLDDSDKNDTLAKPLSPNRFLPALIMFEIIENMTVTKPFLPAFATVKPFNNIKHIRRWQKTVENMGFATVGLFNNINRFDAGKKPPLKGVKTLPPSARILSPLLFRGRQEVTGMNELKEKMKRIIEAAGELKPGVKNIEISHDENCPALKTKSLIDCTCEPEFKVTRPDA